MSVVSDIEIRLRADIARLRQDLQNGRRAVDSSFAQMGAAVNKFKSMMAGLAAGIGLSNLVSQLVNAQREFDKLNSQLITATGSTENAGRAFKALKEFAASTPFSLAEVTKAFIQLRNLGLTPSERALTSYGNTASSMGKDLNQLIEAVADASTGEFERLKEFGIKSKQEGDKVKFTFQGVTTAVGKSAAEIEEYLVRLGETKFAGGMAQQASTLDGAISNLGDTWAATLRTVNQSGFGDLAADGVKVLVGVLEDLRAMFKVVAGEADSHANSVDKVSIVHKSITTVFETVAVLGVNVAYVFNQIGKELGGLAAQAVLVAKGDLAGAKAVGVAMKAEAEQARKDVDAKSEAILGASAKAQAAAAAEAAERKAAGKDRLAEFGIIKDGNKEVSDEAVKAAAKQVQAYKDMVLAIKERITESAHEAAGLATLNEAQKMGLKLDEQMAAGKVKLTAEQEKNYRALIATHGANLEVIESNKRAAKGAEQFAKIQAGLVDDRERAVDAAGKEAEASEWLARTFGRTAGAIEKLELARLEEQMAQRASNGLTLDEIEHLEKLIVLKKRSAAALADVDDLRKQKDMWESIEKTARDTFVSILDGGKDAATRLRDTFKNIFFDWLYQQTLKKWIIQLSPQTTGGGGLLDSVGKMFETSGGGGTGVVQAGKMLYQSFAKSMSTGLGDMVSKMGSMFGSKAMTAFGSGMSGTAGAGATGAAGAGATAAKMIPIAGWIAAGMMANNKFFDQGWDIEGQVNDIFKSQISSMFKGNGLAPLGAIMTASTGSADKLLRSLGVNDKMASMIAGSAVWTRAFGHKKAEIESQGIRGTATADGFSGEAFANILQKGGWFRSDKRSTTTSTLAADQDKTFDDTITAMTDAVRGFGAVLGVEAKVIEGYSKAINIKLTNDEEKNKAMLAELFGSIGDELSTRLLPDIAAFAKGSETASATLQRLATNFQVVTAVLDAMSITSQQAFGAVGTASIEARERLVALAGGVEALASQSDFFADNFMTAAQRVAPVQKMLTERLAALGYAGVQTTEQFRDAVMDLAQSGKLATEKGAETYAGLLALAPAFKQVTDYMAETKRAAEELAASSLEAALQRATAQNARQKQAMSDLVDSSLSALENAVGRQKDVVGAAYAKNMGDLQNHIERINSSISTTRELSQALKQAAGGMGVSGAEGAARASAQAQIATALKVAKATGVLPSAEDLRSALTAAKGSPDQFSSFADYVRDTARTASDIAQLGAITDNQLSVQERQLMAAIEQRDQMKAAYEAEILRLDGILSLAQQQVDATRGVDSSVKSLLSAWAGLQGALAGAVNPPTVNAAGAVTGGLTVEDLYRQVLGREGRSGGVSFWKNAFGDSVDADEIRSFLKGAEAELAAKAAGTWQHFLDTTGSGPPIYAPPQAGVVGDTSALLTELQTLNTRMMNVEKHTGQFATQFDDATGGGGPLLVTQA
jgi:hypothetical protein